MSIQVEWALLFYGLACAGICAVMARHKARHVGLWSLLGFVFGIFAVIFLSFRGRSMGEDDRF